MTSRTPGTETPELGRRAFLRTLAVAGLGVCAGEWLAATEPAFWALTATANMSRMRPLALSDR